MQARCAWLEFFRVLLAAIRIFSLVFPFFLVLCLRRLGEPDNLDAVGPCDAGFRLPGLHVPARLAAYCPVAREGRPHSSTDGDPLSPRGLRDCSIYKEKGKGVLGNRRMLEGGADDVPLPDRTVGRPRGATNRRNSHAHEK